MADDIADDMADEELEDSLGEGGTNDQDSAVIKL